MELGHWVSQGPWAQHDRAIRARRWSGCLGHRHRFQGFEHLGGRCKALLAGFTDQTLEHGETRIELRPSGQSQSPPPTSIRASGCFPDRSTRAVPNHAGPSRLPLRPGVPGSVGRSRLPRRGPHRSPESSRNPIAPADHPDPGGANSRIDITVHHWRAPSPEPAGSGAATALLQPQRPVAARCVAGSDRNRCPPASHAPSKRALGIEQLTEPRQLGVQQGLQHRPKLSDPRRWIVSADLSNRKGVAAKQSAPRQGSPAQHLDKTCFQPVAINQNGARCCDAGFSHRRCDSRRGDRTGGFLVFLPMQGKDPSDNRRAASALQRLYRQRRRSEHPCPHLCFSPHPSAR